MLLDPTHSSWWRAMQPTSWTKGYSGRGIRSPPHPRQLPTTSLHAPPFAPTYIHLLPLCPLTSPHLPQPLPTFPKLSTPLPPSTQVRIVPVTRVNYDWKGRGRSYYVYGYENKVHLPGGSYPQACCWGCALM